MLSRFDTGLFISDFYTRKEVMTLPGARLFQWALSAFARGRVHVSWDDADDGCDALHQAGFAAASLELASGQIHAVNMDSARRNAYVRIIKAITEPGGSADR